MIQDDLFYNKKMQVYIAKWIVLRPKALKNALIVLKCEYGKGVGPLPFVILY